jgi:hypothetical protein
MERTTLTVDNNVRFDVGDDLSVTTMDKRWWKRLLHFMACRNSPTLTAHYKIIDKEGCNTVTIECK